MHSPPLWTKSVRVARSAKDLAAVLDVISGMDLNDGTSVEKDITGCLGSITGEMKGKKIGLPSDYFAKGLDGEVKDRILAAAQEFANMGAIVEEFPMPMIEYAIPAYGIIPSAEASSNLSRYDGIKYGFRAKDYDDLIDMFYKSQPGFRCRGETPDYARELRSVLRLLRCVL